MYITDAFGNITERFMSKHINLIYRPNNNLFDHCISLLPYATYSIANTTKEINNIKYIHSVDFPNRQYNIELNNSLLDFANQKKTNTILGLNTISFCHHEKMPIIKKEDLFLLKNNLNSATIVFFSKYAAKSWGFNKTFLMPYGIPKDQIKQNANKTNELLVFNLDNKNISAIESILASQNIKHSVVTKIDDDLFNKLNSYKVCLEMNDSNVINALYSIACGGIGIVPKTNMIQNDFLDINNLRSFNDISSMIGIIKESLEATPVEDNIEEKFAFSTFDQAISLLINQINKEVVLL